jgi:hypothetical protein
MAAQHILKELKFPARYEALVGEVGHGVANLLVPPAAATREAFQQVAAGVRARVEGSFLPIYAPPGTGKTTLAHGLGKFLPADYSETLTYSAPEVTFDALNEVFALAAARAPANEARIRPVLIDDREGNLPSRAEYAAMKRFLRSNPWGTRAVIVWPETDDASAVEMTSAYEAMAGASVILLPLHVDGPPTDAWQAIATSVLVVVNGVEDLPSLGVDPAMLDPAEFRTIGDFMRQLSNDFNALTLSILRSTQRPLRLVVLFASKTPDGGQLSHLTSTSRRGLLDAGALIDATSESDEGRFWAPRRGDLVHTIIQLDAHAFSLPPQVSMPALRVHGRVETKQLLNDAGMVSTSADHAKKALLRSDFGKFLRGIGGSTTEQRGTPATVSEAGFVALASAGFTGGRDKFHNKDLLDAWQAIFPLLGIAASEFKAEQGLGFVPMIPDNRFDIEDVTYCLEYTWRGGDYLSTRSGAAGYLLSKLRQYAIQLGITTP